MFFLNEVGKWLQEGLSTRYSKKKKQDGRHDGMNEGLVGALGDCLY